MNKEKNPRQEKPKCSAFEAQASMLDAVILFFFFKVRLFILFYFFEKRENICRSLVQILSINEWLKIKSTNFSSKEPVFQSILSFNHKTLLEYQETDLSPKSKSQNQTKKNISLLT